MTYAGMKWLKCDLHMHTPIDTANWLGSTISTGDLPALAVQYAQACIDTGLDVIAITDHNFESKNFIPVLREEFKKRGREGGKSVTIFPGFEFEANVGRGVHVLALFSPEADIEEIDAALTECGISYPRKDGSVFKKSTKTLPDILETIQNEHNGIVILPHCQSNDGIFDNDNIADWLQQDQYKNPELLAVEVPKQVSEMSNGFQKLFRSGNDCTPEWRRIRPIATIMSSDCKQLCAANPEGVPLSNSIGYRFSWIKMSAPSIESLRQAFLDHESRIVLPQNHKDLLSPENKNKYFRIKSLSINNAKFLNNQEVLLSPNLNTFIGGRGCGKSTILEYLRILLKKENDLDDITAKKVNRIKNTIAEDTTLAVTIENQDGVSDSIEFKHGMYSVAGRELTDEAIFYDKIPVTFFSQQQITHLTDFIDKNSDEFPHLQTKQLLGLIDGFVKEELNILQKQEDAAIEAVNDSFSIQSKIQAAQNAQNKLRQELTELERQWKAHHEIENDAQKHKLLQTEKILWNDIEKYENSIESQYKSAVEYTGNNLTCIEEDDLPHKALLNTLQQKIKESYGRLQKAVSAALNQFTLDFESLKDTSWQAMKQDLDNADAVFQKACEALGLSPDAVGHLRSISENIERKKNEIVDYNKMIERLSTGAEQPDIALTRLHKIWREQFELRREAATQGNNLAKLEGSDQPFIKIEVFYSSDYPSFCKQWAAFSPQDRRTKLGRSWIEIGQRLYDKFRTSNIDSPWSLLISDAENHFCNIAKELQCDPQEFQQYVSDNTTRFRILLTSRVQDSIDITLYRADGSEAGSISKGSLSDGQRNTAALVLLLSQKGGPLIIDQPEDELDSNFVYKELIPMLRRVKKSRQIIVATHNANLPVNGDAELIYALEAKNGHGSVLNQGGLDRQEVTQAILDIMEGSEEAFRKRREKYHF